MGNKKSRVHSLILTDNDIDILSSKTGLSRKEIQAWHSQFLQDNPHGYIDKKHFEKIYYELYPNGNPEISSKLAFQVFDLNRSGKITFSEFLIATSIPKTDQLCPAVRGQLEKLFNVYDSNTDAFIDRGEIEKFFEAVAECQGLDPTRVRNEIHKFLNERKAAENKPKFGFTRQESIDFMLSQPF